MCWPRPLSDGIIDRHRLILWVFMAVDTFIIFIAGVLRILPELLLFCRAKLLIFLRWNPS